MQMADEGTKHYRTILEDLPPTDPAEIEAIKERVVEDRHYAAIGRVAASWAYFEALVNTASINLANIDVKAGVCFTAQIFGIGRKLDAFIALAKLKGASSKLIEDMHTFATAVRNLGVQRDRVVHDVWRFPHPNPPLRFEATAVKSLRLIEIAVPTEQLQRLNSHIEDLPHRFAALLARLHIELHPLPGTPP
jgi:hypothetical protein